MRRRTAHLNPEREEGNNASVRRKDQWNDGLTHDRIIEDFQGVNEETRPELFTDWKDRGTCDWKNPKTKKPDEVTVVDPSTIQ